MVQMQKVTETLLGGNLRPELSKNAQTLPRVVIACAVNLYLLRTPSSLIHLQVCAVALGRPDGRAAMVAVGQVLDGLLFSLVKLMLMRAELCFIRWTGRQRQESVEKSYSESQSEYDLATIRSCSV